MNEPVKCRFLKIGMLLVAWLTSIASLNLFGQQLETTDDSIEANMNQDQAQSSAQLTDDFQKIVQSVPIEEITITAEKSTSAVRIEFSNARRQFFSDYNDLNMIDQFDVECKRQKGTNSHISREVCWPVFLQEAFTTSAQEYFMGIGVFEPAQISAVEQSNKFVALRENVVKIANESPDLKESFLEFIRLDSALKLKQEECENRPAFLFVFKICN